MSPGGVNETGHSGNGYARITPLPPSVMYTITILVGDNGVASGGGVYESDTQITVTATPDEGYKLTGWYEDGAQVSTSNSYSFTVNGNRTLTAVFAEIPVYTISTTIDPSGGGTVTGAGQYQEGTTVTLVATPKNGYNFTGWKEGSQTVSTNTTYTFTVTGNRDLTVVFEEVHYIAGVDWWEATLPSSA